MRTIQSIRKAGKSIYVNFSNGTFGTRSFENGKWTTDGLKDDELAEAKRVAVRDGKWINYRAPRNEPVVMRRVHLDEEELADRQVTRFNEQHSGIRAGYLEE